MAASIALSRSHPFSTTLAGVIPANTPPLSISLRLRRRRYAYRLANSRIRSPDIAELQSLQPGIQAGFMHMAVKINSFVSNISLKPTRFQRAAYFGR
ncbi:DUF1010 domain-containing protein [Comamonas badia]|uniref:DUF1010 domain-containing protein n=1 Tax=Comamonas badia TaxID=265291 RepID=UPI00387E1475